MPADAKVQTQSEVEEKMVDLPSEGLETEVEIKDDPNKIETKKPEVKVEEESPQASEKEVEEYSEDVKRRINKLTFRLREAERREATATQFAQNVHRENEGLKNRTKSLDTGYISEYESRVVAETDAAKKKLKQSLETGDVDGQVDAQQSLSRLAIENERVKSTQAQRKKMAEDLENAPPRQYQQPTMPPPPQPDEKAEEWAQKNEWFGKDEPMTLTSFSIHRKLVEEGIDPQSNLYYNEVDKRMRENFPHKFDRKQPPAQSVASATRGTNIAGRRRGTVRLTPSQVAIAKKIGVPLEEYAKYVKE
tara:strand:- start:2953 stop:3870 length:918 start_codon:yes stop_codon:yes gene_type:complete